MSGDDILRHALELERRVWAALVAGDAEADGALLSADFLGVYPQGFEDREAHKAHLSGGPAVAAWRISAATARAISANAILLSYRADWSPAGGEGERTMYVSSLWERRGGAWLNTFSQDTPASA